MQEAQKCELRTHQLCDGYNTWRWASRPHQCSCYCALIRIYEMHKAYDEASLARYQRALAVSHKQQIRHHCEFVQRHLASKPGPDNGEEAGSGR